MNENKLETITNLFEGSELTTICRQLKLKLSDEKYYNQEVLSDSNNFDSRYIDNKQYIC